MPTNKNDFFAALKEEWYKIDESYLTQLVNSMPKRINAVIKSKGNPTKY